MEAVAGLSIIWWPMTIVFGSFECKAKKLVLRQQMELRGLASCPVLVVSYLTSARWCPGAPPLRLACPTNSFHSGPCTLDTAHWPQDQKSDQKRTQHPDTDHFTLPICHAPLAFSDSLPYFQNNFMTHTEWNLVGPPTGPSLITHISHGVCS